MAPIAQLIEQLKQATANSAATTSTLGKPAVTWGGASSISVLPSKADQDLISEDRASTCSGSKTPESLATSSDFQPLKVNDELVSRLILDNAKLTRRIDEIERKLVRRIEQQSSDLSGKLVQRVDELENGVSVVIHDLISVKRNVDAKMREAVKHEELQQLCDAVQGLMADTASCKNAIDNCFGVKQRACTPVPINASAHQATNSTTSANTPSDTNASSVPSFRQQLEKCKQQFAVQEVPGRCESLSARQCLSKSRLSSHQTSPVRSQFSSQRASPVRSSFADEQGAAGAVDRRASPVRFAEQQMQPQPSGVVRCAARLLDRRVQPVTQAIPEESDSLHCEAQLLDHMIAESEKTLGKIKMIAETKGLSVNQSPRLEGRGSMTLPVGSARTNEAGVPPPPVRRIYSGMSTSTTPATQWSRPISVATTPCPKSPM